MLKLLRFFLILVIITIAIPPKEVTLDQLIKQFNINNAVNTYYASYVKEIKNANVIQNGCMVLFQSNLQDCVEIKKNLSRIDGQSITFCGNEELYQEIIMKIFSNIVRTEQVGSILSCYGNVNGLRNCIEIDNKNINIQIVINNNLITIGTPVILGSY